MGGRRNIDPSDLPEKDLQGNMCYLLIKCLGHSCSTHSGRLQSILSLLVSLERQTGREGQIHRTPVCGFVAPSTATEEGFNPGSPVWKTALYLLGQTLTPPEKALKHTWLRTILDPKKMHMWTLYRLVREEEKLQKKMKK